MNKTELRYIFQEPQFPVICSIDGYFIGAGTVTELESELQQLQLDKDGHYPVIDSSGEGWVFSVEHMAISPFSQKKRWTKKELVGLFNQRTNRKIGQGVDYSKKSLSSKRLDRIIYELVDLALL